MVKASEITFAKPNEKIEHHQFAVIGCGFGGMAVVTKLREMGLNDIKGFDVATAPGGVWRNNRYPGARVDSDVPVYQLFLKQTTGFTFSERFPGYKEIQKYFDYADTQLSVSELYSFETMITHAEWSDEEKLWHLKAEGKHPGHYTVNFLMNCTGFASKKLYPKVNGLGNFKGPAFHTADWPEIDLTGKRVAVIGTGASGVQTIQEIGPKVKELVVFQRTPNLAIPMRQRTQVESEQEKRRPQYQKLFESLRKESFAGFEFNPDPRKISEISEEDIRKKFDESWENGGFRFWIGAFSDVLKDPESNKVTYNYWKEKVQARIKDPRKRQILAPDVQPHYIFTKRPCLEQYYYEVFNQDNVDIVDLKAEPITSITENGVQTSNKHYEFDVIIYATGFDAITGGFYQMNLKGENGVSIDEKWKTGTSTYLGLTIAGFPNHFYLYGPQAPTAFCNGPSCNMAQTVWIMELLKFMNANGFRYANAKEEAQKGWRDYITDQVYSTLLPHTDSWYMGALRESAGKRKEGLLYVLGLDSYVKDIQKEADEGYQNFLFA